MSGRAIIMCGGLGTRLKPLTLVMPKSLVPIGGQPILEIIICQLALQGFDHVTLAVNHQAEMIKAYIGDGARFQLRIDYSLESMALSTMGPLKLIPDLPDSFLVMNGDVLTDLNFYEFLTHHMQDKNIFTISSASREQKIDFGVLDCNSSGFLTGFQEKPTNLYQVSMGVYALSNKILDFIPSGTSYGFDNLIYDLLKSEENVRVRSYAGYWLDIGRISDYEQALEDFEKFGDKFVFGSKKN